MYKKIYLILCFLFGLFLFIEIINHAACLNDDFADLCYTYYTDSLYETIIRNLIIFFITVPIYFILKWLFKKKNLS